jgi:peptidoglycan/LPS O-acetylase OafA/YrhL
VNIDRQLELTLVGRTYMMFVYIISTVFIFLVLGAVLNATSDHPSKTVNLYLAMGMWLCFVAGGIVYEYHRESFKRMGLKRRSVKIFLPLVLLLMIGLPVIAVSDYVEYPPIRLVFSVILVLVGTLMWRVGSMLIREKRKSYMEREF